MLFEWLWQNAEKFSLRKYKTSKKKKKHIKTLTKNYAISFLSPHKSRLAWSNGQN